jgi:8-oxo-dGTP pyrophosphatase MutT (NUDIX family)
MRLADRLRARLAATEGHPVPFVNDMRRAILGPGTPAAVLVAVTDRTEPGLILTQRPDTMRHHAGQIAFPGGRVDPGDTDSVAAALREAEEEVELSRNAVELIGTLDPYRTITGYDIMPVLGVIAPDLPLVPHVREVADVFEVPLGFVLDGANHRAQSVMFEGDERTYIEIMWGTRRIWGATAAMLVNLSVRLKW